MALYAFDGTGNEDKDEDGQDSNVLKFCEVYGSGKSVYLSGVGTRLGTIGKVIGGIFGAGGRTRIDEMMDALQANYLAGDHDIDVIGFSRGAALAIHFCNVVAEEGIKNANGELVHPPIRFVGVWDIVGSFGIAADTFINFQEINIGWTIDSVPNIVGHCYHALALDERRETFGETRLDPDHNASNVTELWFRGVHSDVGGGNDNPSRSNIALNWVITQARNHGIEFDEDRLAKPKYSAVNPEAIISENKDPKRDARREVLDGDEIHESAKGRELAPGESHTASVDAKLKYNWSGVRVSAGQKYEISVDPDSRWTDTNIECDANGWESEQLPWYKEGLVELFEKARRVPDANWFALCGSVGDEDDDLLEIGMKNTISISKNGYLYLFANDLTKMYGNNRGEIDVTIKRTA